VLPVEADSRNFMIEWLVLLLYLMVMISLATLVASRWLAGASAKLAAAT